jgi:hypothetical protein
VISAASALEFAEVPEEDETRMLSPLPLTVHEGVGINSTSVSIGIADHTDPAQDKRSTMVGFVAHSQPGPALCASLGEVTTPEGHTGVWYFFDLVQDVPVHFHCAKLAPWEFHKKSIAVMVMNQALSFSFVSRYWGPLISRWGRRFDLSLGHGQLERAGWYSPLPNGCRNNK